jgi:hypothetical protein
MGLSGLEPIFHALAIWFTFGGQTGGCRLARTCLHRLFRLKKHRPFVIYRFVEKKFRVSFAARKNQPKQPQGGIR